MTKYIEKTKISKKHQAALERLAKLNLDKVKGLTTKRAYKSKGNRFGYARMFAKQ